MPKDKPEIRFAGYTDAWEQCKLSDEMTDFIVPMRDKPKEFGGNIPWTRIEDIEGKFLNDSLSEQYVTEETIQKMNLKIIPKDSLIVSSSATFGVVAVVTQDLITNQTFIGLVPREKNTLDYWYSFFQSSEARKYMKLQSAGSTIFYIARDSFEKMPISVPKIDEMIKIGEYFSNLDNLIALHQRKLDLLKEQKKGYLQKMFPKNGSKVPELRFAGFADDWEKRKLGDIMDVTSVKRIHQSDWKTTGVPFYRARDLVSLAKNFPIAEPIFIDKDTYENYSKKSGKVKRNELLVTGVGTLGIAYLVPNDEPLYFKDGNVIWFRNNTLNGNFLYYSFMTTQVQKFIKLSAGTGTVGTYTIESGKKTIISVPIKNEQQKIGDLFQKLDQLITVNQRRVDLLKQEKKALLQKMFV
ncbi:restriction endonuclease subunit S [Weissella paramesenteroides]|uniref:restriction endonuclease subunit S n=1 Tax=Weissella paramesenteroides TaxID=1249 RepID=UPI003F2266E7